MVKNRRKGEFYTMSRRSDYTVSWSALEPTIVTGDIVLFSGQSITSKFIQEGQGGTDWSHIGMFIRSSNDPGGRVLLLESTTFDGMREVRYGKHGEGVRLVDAEACIKHYLGYDDTTKVITRQIFVDRSMIEHGIVNPAMRYDALWAFIDRVYGRPYEQSPFELARAMHRGLEILSKRRTKGSYFCSELVAEAYMTMGLLPSPKLAHNNPLQQKIILNQEAHPDNGVPMSANKILGRMERTAAAYTPLDFSQEAQNLPFLYNSATRKKLVDLGPHLDIVFADRVDPTTLVPPQMTDPVRPH